MLRSPGWRRFGFPILTVVGALAFSALVYRAQIAPKHINVLSYKEAQKARTNFVETPKPQSSDIDTEKMIARGLAHLVSIQDKESGAWIGDIGLKFGVGGGAYQVDHRKKEHIGITALACMALVAAGNTPTSGPYSANLNAGTNYILSHVTESGEIVHNGTRMYSSAFAALYLAEVYGMFGGSKVGEKLRKAIEFIEKKQVSKGKNKGGWRYVPGQNDADVSVTVCLLQALRAARNAGVVVHQSTIDAARDYIVSTFDPDYGGFSYQPSETYGRKSFALAAAGIVSLQSIGNYDSFRHNGQDIYLDRSFRYMKSHRPDEGVSSKVLASSNSRHYCDFAFWYGHYYAAQAMRQRGNVAPREWQEWNNTNRRHFRAMQDPETGAWTDAIGNFRPEESSYATAMACLILSIPNNYLPIFQH